MKKASFLMAAACFVSLKSTRANWLLGLPNGWASNKLVLHLRGLIENIVDRRDRQANKRPLPARPRAAVPHQMPSFPSDALSRPVRTTVPLRPSQRHQYPPCCGQMRRTP